VFKKGKISKSGFKKDKVATLALKQERNNETMEYYETVASFTLFHKRLGKIRHVNPDV